MTVTRPPGLAGPMLRHLRPLSAGLSAGPCGAGFDWAWGETAPGLMKMARSASVAAVTRLRNVIVTRNLPRGHDSRERSHRNPTDSLQLFTAQIRLYIAGAWRDGRRNGTSSRSAEGDSRPHRRVRRPHQPDPTRPRRRVSAR